MVKLGDYSLKKVETFTGREGYGLNAQLYRGKDLIAYAHDGGNGGGMDITLNREVVGNDDSVLCSAIVYDMTKLLGLIYVDKKVYWMAQDFTKNVYSACEGFVELLMVLRNYQSLANKLAKQCNEDTYYVIAELGNSWFKDGGDPAKVSAWVINNVTDYNLSQTKVMCELAKTGDVNCGCLITRGKRDLKLSFEEYAEIYKDFV